ncbi:MAG: hypothetical protein GF353_28160 [Candidatus Lokiarchaeota archaeon]|nr:hypothetical protein [Candidatus Lokiarchaeota archaeon]
MKRHFFNKINISPFFLLSFFLLSCDENKTVMKSDEVLPPLPPFELEATPEPSIASNQVVVISHSRYLFHNLALEIRDYYNSALIHFNENSSDQISEKLKIINPQYAIVVLPPFIIDLNSVADLFFSFCSLDDEIDMDVGYCYITGSKVEDARDLFYRNKANTAVIDSYLGISHVFDGDEWCHSAVNRYKNIFDQNNWEANTIIVNSDSWLADKNVELSKFDQNQMIFFIGHGSGDTSCDLNVTDVDCLNLTGCCIFAGSCYTGMTSYKSPDREFIALKIIEKGAFFYVSNVGGNGWDNVWFIAENLCKSDIALGDAVQRGINQQMEWRDIRELNILHYDYQNESDLLESDLMTKVTNSMARIIPFGDPLFKPQLKSRLDISLE